MYFKYGIAKSKSVTIGNSSNLNIIYSQNNFLKIYLILHFNNEVIFSLICQEAHKFGLSRYLNFKKNELKYNSCIKVESILVSKYFTA